METTMNLNLPEDFMNLCSIYNIQPQQFIQSFVDNISFPSFYTGAQKDEKWATYFFLHYIESEGYGAATECDLENEYLQCFTDTLAANLEQYDDGGAKAREEGRGVIRKWHKAVLAERTKYIMDQL